MRVMQEVHIVYVVHFFLFYCDFGKRAECLRIQRNPCFGCHAR